MEQELRLKREAAERAFEAQAEKDRTLMRLEELRFLATSTKDLDDDDAYWIKNRLLMWAILATATTCWDSCQLLAVPRIDSSYSTLIKEAQRDDGELWAIVQNVEDSKHTEFSVDDDGVVWFEDRLCVPNDQALREKVMTEAHSSSFTIHPGLTKMYRDLKQYFWWNGMKQDVATFVSKCMTCQQVKIEHQRASGLLQPLEIPITYGISKLAEIFRQEIVRLHGTPTSIVSDRDPKFTSHFWKGLQKAWGTRLKFSTTFHPQTDGQSERTIQTLEDMLRACALEWTCSWIIFVLGVRLPTIKVCMLASRPSPFRAFGELNVWKSSASTVLDSLVRLRFSNVLESFVSLALPPQFIRTSRMSFMYPLWGDTIIIHACPHLNLLTDSA
ncbi:retrotransposable element Tf2 [Tanacetum coccineum]